jgi:hypothetical protein
MAIGTALLPLAGERMPHSIAAAPDAFRSNLISLVNTAGAAGGALCLFDAEEGVLRLAAEVGLSDEGCRTLRTIRRDEGWDIPLASLLDGNPIILADTAASPLPPLLDEPGSLSSVACVPIGERRAPVGTLVLVAAPPRLLDAETVRDLAPKLGSIEAVVSALHEEVATITGRDRWRSSLLPLRAGVTEAAIRQIESVLDHARRVATVARRVPGLREVVKRLESPPHHVAVRLGTLQARAERLWAEVKQLEVAARERDGVDTVLRERLYDAEARAARQRQRAHVLGQDCARVGAELAAARAELGESRAELERIVARRGEDRGDALEEAQALVLAVEQARAAAEQTRDATVMELEKLRAALGAIRVQHREPPPAASKPEGLEERRGAPGRGLSEMEALRRELAHAQQEGIHAAAELTRARSRVEQLEIAARGSVAEHARLTAALDAAEVREREAIARIEDLESELAVARVTEAVTRGRARPAAGAARAPRRPSPPAAPRPGTASPARDVASRPLIVVLDGDGAWGEVAPEDMTVEVVHPDAAAVARTLAIAPSHLIVNLAASGALDRLAAMKAAGVAAPSWACVGVPTAEEIVTLGVLDVGSRPLDVEAVLAWVTGFANRGTRVLAAGANVNALISLREALARAGMSVSMAWDVKQTVDLVAMVRPQVMVLDMDLPPAGAQTVLATLAMLEQPPTTYLVPGTRDPAVGFVAALKDPREELQTLARGLYLAKVAAT